jgi:DNA-directed RNA polymerase specialized sigma24 family protein
LRATRWPGISAVNARRVTSTQSRSLAQGSATEARTDLQYGLAQLSDADRELLTLRFYDDLPTPILAEVLGI